MGAGEIVFWVIVATGFTAVTGFVPRRAARKSPAAVTSYAASREPGEDRPAAHVAVLDSLKSDALRPVAIGGKTRVLSARFDARAHAEAILAGAGLARSLSQDAMIALVELCDTSPREGLARIEALDAQTRRHPLVRFARVVALRRLIFGSPEEYARRFGDDHEAFFRSVGRDQVDLAAQALKEIAEIEREAPEFFLEEEADVVANAICFVIERKRPASVQKELGWTKVAYFGPERVLTVLEDNPITEQLKDVPEHAMTRMVLTRFSCPPIVRLAVAVSGRRSAGDGWVVLFGLFERESMPRGGKLGDAKLMGFLTVSERGRWRFDPPSQASLSFAADRMWQGLSRPDLARIEANRHLERIASELRDISRKLN